MVVWESHVVEIIVRVRVEKNYFSNFRQKKKRVFVKQQHFSLQIKLQLL